MVGTVVQRVRNRLCRSAAEGPEILLRLGNVAQLTVRLPRMSEALGLVPRAAYTRHKWYTPVLLWA